MSFEQFLSTAAVDNQIALDDAKLYAVNVDSHRVGSGQGRGFLIEENIWPTLRTIQDDKAHPLFGLADGVVVTASDASSYFGINPATSEGMGNIVASQVLVDALIMTSAQRNAFLNKSITVTYPFADKTLEDVLKIRQPAVWTACDHGGQAFIASVLSTDKFNFSVLLADNTYGIQIRCLWSTINGAQEFLASDYQTIAGTDALAISKQIPKSSFRLPPEARSIRFEYLTEYAGLVTSISVSK